MSKKKSTPPPRSPLTAFWEGMAPFRGPITSLVGMVLFVTNIFVVQIVGVVFMLVGGLLIGDWFRKRQDRIDAEKVIQRKIEKKEARKAARAARLAGDTEDDDEDDEEENNG